MAASSRLKSKTLRFSPDPGVGARLGDGDIAELDMPAENDLRRGPAVRGREVQHHGILQDLAAAQRAPRLGGDPKLAVQRA